MSAHNLRAAWRPPESAVEKPVSSEPRGEGISFSGFGYQPTAFEEPSGKGWIVVGAVLLALLGIGTVMAIGPANVKSLVFRHSASSTSGEAGPPPPASAAEKARTGSPVATSSDLPADAPPESVSVPDKKHAQTPANADFPELNRQPTSGEAQDPAETRQAGADADAIETPEETAAKVRQFQLEHSGTNPTASTRVAPPTIADNGMTRPQQAVAQANAVNAYADMPPEPTRSSVNTVPAPAPGAPNQAAAPSGTVAISSHFQAIKSAEPQPSDSLQIGRLASFLQPSYPIEAVRARVEGTVLLRVTVNQIGAVENVQLVSGPPLLVAAAINAVRQWRYGQTILNGRAVESVDDITVVFHLGNTVASPR